MIGSGAGKAELEFDAVLYREAENVVVRRQRVCEYESVWDRHVETRAHAAELEWSRQVVIFHGTTIARPGGS
jgi:hypothetical protein